MRRIALILAGGLFLPAPAPAQTVPPSRAGFPLVIPGTGHVYGHPVIADLKWAGAASAWKSIVFTSWSDAQQKAFLHLVRYDGTAWSEPAPFPFQYSTAPGLGSAAVADLDGDGVPELVVPYGSADLVYAQYRKVGGVKVYRRDGSLLWDRPNSDAFPSYPGANYPFGVVGTPTVADVDGDGRVEVAWGALDGKVYLVDGPTGANKPGWPIFIGETVFSSPVLFDFDGDGKGEFIIGVDSTFRGPPWNTPDGGVLHVFFFNGTGTGSPNQLPVPELPGFPKNYDQVLFSAPAVGDIDGDGRPEIVFGTGTYWGNPPPCGSGIGPLRLRRVYAVKCDGSSPAGWPVTTDGEVSTSPALADLNGDGILDVVVTDVDCSTGTRRNFNVYGFKGDDGTRLFKTPVMVASGVSIGAGDPVVADVFGDLGPEILVPTGGEVTLFTSTGTQITPTGPGTGILYIAARGAVANAAAISLKVSPTASDPVDLLAASSNLLTGDVDTEIWDWNPRTDPLPAPPWGMFRQNASRLALAPGTASCSPAPVPMLFYTLSPCRAVDTRGPAGPYGGPVLGPGAIRVFDLADRCGVPADARAVAVNIAVTQPAGGGHLTLFPGGLSVPATSTLNFNAGRTRANNAVLPLSTDGLGRLGIQNGSGGTVHVVVDVDGFFR